MMVTLVPGHAFGETGIVSGGGAIFMPLALFASRRGTTAIMSLTASISGNTRKLLTDNPTRRVRPSAASASSVTPRKLSPCHETSTCSSAQKRSSVSGWLACGWSSRIRQT
jgi:hypothetical protein